MHVLYDVGVNADVVCIEKRAVCAQLPHVFKQRGLRVGQNGAFELENLIAVPWQHGTLRVTCELAASNAISSPIPHRRSLHLFRVIRAAVEQVPRRIPAIGRG